LSQSEGIRCDGCDVFVVRGKHDPYPGGWRRLTIRGCRDDMTAQRTFDACSAMCAARCFDLTSVDQPSRLHALGEPTG